MSYDDPKPVTATSDLKLKAGGIPVYKRVLDLFEAAVEEQIIEESLGTNPDGTKKKKTDDTIVTEGEICR